MLQILRSMAERGSDGAHPHVLSTVRACSPLAMPLGNACGQARTMERWSFGLPATNRYEQEGPPKCPDTTQASISIFPLSTQPIHSSSFSGYVKGTPGSPASSSSRTAEYTSLSSKLGKSSSFLVNASTWTERSHAHNSLVFSQQWTMPSLSSLM